MERVVVDFDKRTAGVFTNGARVKVEALVAALTQAGFPGSSVIESRQEPSH